MLLAEVAREARPVAFPESPASRLAGRPLPSLVDELERTRTAVARRAIAERRAVSAHRDVADAEIALRDVTRPTAELGRGLGRRAKAQLPDPDSVGYAQRRLAQARAAADEAEAALAATPAPGAGDTAALEDAIVLRGRQVQADVLRDPPVWLRTDVARRVAAHPPGHHELDPARLARAYGRVATYAERSGLADAECINDILAPDPLSDALIRHRMAVVDDLGPSIGVAPDAGIDLSL